jgi:DNA-binding Xre family transcriptional regulator
MKGRLQMTEKGTIRNRFKILLAEKETREGRKYTYLAIQAETGIATSTLTDWARGRTRYYSADTLAALCAFFECVPGDLLEYVPGVE